MDFTTGVELADLASKVAKPAVGFLGKEFRQGQRILQMMRPDSKEVSEAELERRTDRAVSIAKTAINGAGILASGGGLLAEEGLIAGGAEISAEIEGGAAEGVLADSGNNGWGALQGLKSKASQWISEGINQVGTRLGLSAEDIESGKDIVRTARKVHAFTEEVKSMVHEGHDIVESNNGRVTDKSGKRLRALNLIPQKLLKKTKREVFKGSGVSTRKQFKNHGKYPEWSGSDTLGEKHKKPKAGHHLPYNGAYIPNIKSETELRMHPKHPNGHVKSHVPMGIGERTQLMDVIKGGIGSIHYGSPGSQSFSSSGPFTQSNLLANF